MGTAIVTASSRIEWAARKMREARHAKPRGDLRRAARLRVDDADELHAVHGGEQARVMLPEMADADDRDT